MSDYTDEPVLFTLDGPVNGPAGIRKLFASLVERSQSEPFYLLTIARQDVKGKRPILPAAGTFLPFAIDTS